MIDFFVKFWFKTLAANTMEIRSVFAWPARSLKFVTEFSNGYVISRWRIEINVNRKMQGNYNYTIPNCLRGGPLFLNVGDEQGKIT